MADLATLEKFDSEWSAHRNALREIAAHAGEWAGIPAKIPGERLVVEPSYRFAELFSEKKEPDQPKPDYKLRSHFWSKRHRVHVYICEEADGRITKAMDPGNFHIGMDMRTMGCSVAWGIEQEHNALRLLAGLLPHHAFKMYLLAGMFLETSHRSGITYLFRKLKPTVAMTLREEEVRLLCALCQHPIAYYADSWAGAMCPTDDVVAHLQMMRADEHFYWKRCNQIAPERPEAGL